MKDHLSMLSGLPTGLPNAVQKVVEIFCMGMFPAHGLLVH